MFKYIFCSVYICWKNKKKKLQIKTKYFKRSIKSDNKNDNATTEKIIFYILINEKKNRLLSSLIKLFVTYTSVELILMLPFWENE